MSDEETGGVCFWFGVWFTRLLSPFWFVVGVILDPWWDIRVVVWYSFVVLMYFGYWSSCEWAVELFIVSEGAPLSVVVADCFLVSVVGMLVVVKVDQYWVGPSVLVYPCFETLDTSISWCLVENLVGLDRHAPRSFGAFDRTTSRLEVRKLSLMSPPRNVQ